MHLVSDLPSNNDQSGSVNVHVYTMDAATSSMNVHVNTLSEYPHQPFHQSSNDDVIVPHRLVVPKICITENESDSDDAEEEATSVHELPQVEQEVERNVHESVIEKDSDEGQHQQYRQPFMVYKGHRNARTMVSYVFVKYVYL